jgi:flagellar FliL protein
VKKLVLAVVVIALLGGGAAGAYFFFGQKAEAALPEGAEDHAAEKEKKEEKKGGHGGGGAAGKDDFVELDPLILPIVDNTGVTQTVSIVVVLQVGEDGDAADIKSLEPKLRDAYIQDMYGILNKKMALKDGVIQIAPLKERLNKVSAEVLGEGAVDDVLLQTVSQRKI